MKRTAMIGLALALTLVTGLISVEGEDRKANALLEAALTKETIEGDLKGAITLYEQAVKEAGSNRTLAARAQLRLAAAYQKQGNTLALEIYDRIARDYSDQPAAVSEAQSRMASLRNISGSNGNAPGPGKLIFAEGIFGRDANGFNIIGPFPTQAPPLTQGPLPAPLTQGPLPAPLTQGPLPAPFTQGPLQPQPPPRTIRQIALFDRQGKMLQTVGDPGPIGTMTLSPDGKRVALVRNGGILVFDAKTQNSITLAPGPNDAQPAWSADGKRIAYEVRAGNITRRPGLYIKNSDGSGIEEYITAAPGITLVGWSPDGKYLTFQSNGPTTGADLWVLPLIGDRAPIPVLKTPASENGIRISPDGRYMSYRIIEAGRSDVYVSPFDPINAPANPEKWKITATGPGAAVAGVRWRADGKELYYIDENGGFTAVEVTTTPSFKAGPPKVLFQVPVMYQSAPGQTAGFSDVSADGQIFALMMPR